MSTLSQATGDDGGGGRDDGGGGCGGDGCGGGGGGDGADDGAGGHATARQQQRKAAKRAREKAKRAAARAAQAAEREARAAAERGGDGASAEGGPAKVGQRWFPPEQGSRRHRKHVVRQEAAAADAEAAAGLRAQRPADPEALFAELERLSSMDGEYIVPPTVQRCYFQSLGEWRLERLCRAVDKERLKYAEAKEAAARGWNHLPLRYSLNARALRDKHGVGGPELMSVYHPKTNIVEDELSEDDESGFDRGFDGDDYEDYDVYESHRKMLYAFGIPDDGSGGYDAPPPGCGWREDW